jgi:hypothetical protein
MEIQTDGVITDGLVPRAVPLAGPGQSPGLDFLSQDHSRQETDMRSPPAAWLWALNAADIPEKPAHGARMAGPEGAAGVAGAPRRPKAAGLASLLRGGGPSRSRSGIPRGVARRTGAVGERCLVMRCPVLFRIPGAARRRRQSP